MIADRRTCDVLIIGGGPTGSTTALALARAGISALVVEKTRFPRFHVGESFLPRNFTLIQELGLEPSLRQLAHMPKFGGEFAMGNGSAAIRFCFDAALDGTTNETFNIERAPFDQMLLEEALRAGAQVRQDTGIRQVLALEDGHIEVETDNGERLSARYLIDASGQGAFLGRQLGTRRVFEGHRKVAYFGHFENVERLCGREEGYPTIAMCDEGWFWLIPIDERRTSIGLVMNADAARLVNVPAAQMLAWGIARSPFMRERTRRAQFPQANHVIADFSYSCKPYAGPGYFLVGDAAVFLDPIFSTGICLGMMGAVQAADGIRKLLDGTASHEHVRREYQSMVSNTSSVFFRLVTLYYDHSFRELFLYGSGPLAVHRAIISILSGHIFPRPRFALRWRLKMFEWLVAMNRWLPLVKRHKRFSLFDEDSTESTSTVPPIPVPS